MPATPAAPATLALDHLTVRFPDAERPAVDAVSLDVAAGEVVALLGPSGCGKTTVLRCVAGLQSPTAGRILLDGVDVTALPAHRRGVGLMFQDYALFPHRDVGANVAFGLRMLGRSKDEQRRRVAEVLDMVGLAGWESRSVAPLSGGEQQRVALARALAPAPGVLLLDEPLGALDRSLRDRLLPEMAELFRALGTTVVHVTHDQGEALGMADRVVVMDDGRIAQIGSPAEVWTRPATASVARFLGFANVDDDHLVRPDAVVLTPLTAQLAPRGEVVSPESAAVSMIDGPDAGSAGGPGAGPGAGSEVGPGAGSEVGPGTGSEARSEASLGAGLEAGSEAQPGGAAAVPTPAPLGRAAAGGARGTGVVESVVFTGERAEVRVRLADGSVLEASVATGAVLAPGGPGLPRVGERVGVAVEPSGVVAFP